jgi:hypothetical protein
MSRQKRILYFLLIFTIFVISCDVSTFVPASQNPTAAPNALNVIIAQTAAAAATQTAKLFTPTLTPSATPFPTLVPLDTPTITPTFLFILLSPTPIPQLVMTPATQITPSAKDYDCQITGQTPPNNWQIAASQDFQVNWTIANVGRKSWDSTNVDFVYLGGARIYKSKGADLPKTVAAGEIVSLKLTMTAPKSSGSYKTTWALQMGQNVFCTMSVMIKVP